MRSAFYNGILYQIDYKKELSTNWFTQKHVYHIKTDNEIFPDALTAIESSMKNKIDDCFFNALHSYHTFEYNEELDVYVYTRIVPYDD